MKTFKLILGVVVIIAIIIVAIFVFKHKNAEEKISGTLPSVTLREGWFPWAGYAGVLVAMNETSKQNGIDLKIDPGADDIDPIKLVLSGSNDFGITSAETVMTANDKGADLVVVGAENYKCPAVFVSLRGDLKTPKDFEGKKMGVISGSETETIYRELVKKYNLDKKKITEVEAPFDVATFIATNAYDIRPAFIYDEVLTLNLKGIKYSMLKPEDFGVSVPCSVYFTKRKMIQENPKVVQAFVNSIASGWERAIENPQKAIEYLKQYDNSINSTRELTAFTMGLEYYKGENGKALYVSKENWDNLSNILKGLNKVSNDFDITEYYDNTFIENYQKTKGGG